MQRPSVVTVLHSHCVALLVGLSLALLAGIQLLAQAPWRPIGPDGGDARSFAAVKGDSRHLYMGSTTGWIFESRDGGGSWSRLSRLDGQRNNLVIDHIFVDPGDEKTLLAAAWTLSSGTDGGLWISRDGAHSWREVEALHGQSIRSFAAAPSDARILCVGALEGVFRSLDGGESWQRISPKENKEIHEVESLAIDPTDPGIIYAGTWHLPWKTTDGGKSWRNIKQGVIDDSDVFSILLDPVQPKTVYLSACSGIYKSLDAGRSFHKIEGIPSSARRTRVLHLDPTRRETVYAGTTEGLYRSTDAGRSFRRVTGPEVIVNDIFVDPADPKRILLAVDRGGVLLSEDGGKSFAESNRGFSSRVVQALLVDGAHPNRYYAGVANDKSYGTAFVSDDSGASWRRIGEGLEENDVFALAQSSTGRILAGTSRGLYELEAGRGEKDEPRWRPRNVIANTRQTTASRQALGKTVTVSKDVKEPLRTLESRVSALELSGEVWAAATGAGVLTSRDGGASWQMGGVVGLGDYVAVAVHKTTIFAARADLLIASSDGGQSWRVSSLPQSVRQIQKLAFTADGALWLGSRDGLYFTSDAGKSWYVYPRLQLSGVNDLYYDPVSGRLLASSRFNASALSIDPQSYTAKTWSTGFRMGLVRAVQGRFLGASLYDGLLAGPEIAPPAAPEP